MLSIEVKPSTVEGKYPCLMKSTAGSIVLFQKGISRSRGERGS